MGRPRSKPRTTDPDYDDDGSPKYETNAARAAGWSVANHATNPQALFALDPAEAAAEHLWNHSGAVEANIRPVWADAINAPQWEGPVRQTREQAALAVAGARRILAAQVLHETLQALEVSALGRHGEYVRANRDDQYILKVRASEYLEGAR